MSALTVGDAIRVRDLPESDNYEYVSRPERVVVHVIAPKVEVEEEEEEAAAEEGEEAAAAAAEGAEPEVAEKGKTKESE